MHAVDLNRFCSSAIPSISCLEYAQLVVDVLKHVRKIVSGELTFGAVMDEVVNILNDDKVVAAGEELVKHGEHVLDAIEGVSGNAVVDEVMQIAGKAGITKDTVMEGIENLDVNELLVSLLILFY